jgi:hypothetical protein
MLYRVSIFNVIFCSWWQFKFKKIKKVFFAHDTFNWSDLPDIPEGKYISSAIEINENLHNSGINKNKRARFIAGLVLF